MSQTPTEPRLALTDAPTLTDGSAGPTALADDLVAGAPAALRVDDAIRPSATARRAPAAPAQHGLSEHSHGAGVPASSRAERRTSFTVDDFPVPTGREEEWRFTPLDRARELFTPAGPGAAALGVEVSPAPGVTHRRLGAGDGGRGAAFVPADRAAVVAWADSGGADVVTIAAETDLAEPVTVRLHAGGAGRRPPRDQCRRLQPRHRRRRAHRLGLAATGVEVVVGEGATLTVVSVQQWDDGAVHLTQHDALVGRDATLTHVAVSLGGAVVRMGATVRYDGPGGDATLLGVYFADAGQHLEHRSFVDHAAANCRSNVVYKGALQGQTARTVWVGDVLIRASALGTDTYELNRNLVLTDGARADSVPNLEIETGEIVGAGHASATGRFDDEQLFYLRSRGIPAETARRMVVRAFFADVLAKIAVPSVTERLMAEIDVELARGDSALATAGAGAAG